jgi:hypothetical protein
LEGFHGDFFIRRSRAKFGLEWSGKEGKRCTFPVTRDDTLHHPPSRRIPIRSKPHDILIIITLYIASEFGYPRQATVTLELARRGHDEGVNPSDSAFRLLAYILYHRRRCEPRQDLRAYLPSPDGAGNDAVVTETDKAGQEVLVPARPHHRAPSRTGSDGLAGVRKKFEM